MAQRPLTVAWISYFPVEWLPQAPEAVRNVPRQHPATWQRVLLDELKSLPDIKLHVIAVRSRFERACDFDLDGVSFHCLKLPKGMRTLSLFWWETVLIRRCLKRIKPDMVHAWGTERGAALVASRLGYPYLVTMQGLLEWYSQQVRLNGYQRLEARLERPSLRRASVVTTESVFGVNWLRQHYPRLDVRQVEHAPGWIFHQIERRPRTCPAHLLYVGAMAPIKGTDLLLLALDRLCGELDFVLTIIGSASPGFLEELKAATSSALWKRITIRNDLTSAQVAEEMAQATLMLFPTRADTSPNSVKEAVVAGVPVVASAIGGIVDYVLPGKNGFIFPAGDIEKFIESIRQAVVHPLFGQGQVNAETLKQMRQYLSPRVMADRFLELYQQIATKKLGVRNEL
jgi:glycosyltransferase involved in cell wall biosynthesis